MHSLVLVLCLLGQALAGTPAEILEEARDVQRADNSIQTVRMVLVSKSGSERTRELQLVVVKDGEVVKSYARFTKPSDVAGTQLVMVDNPDRVDEQLLYLPALGRVNRIAGKARKGSFMGSDFTYEDLELSDTEDATHVLVSEDDGTWVIDTTPGADSSYGRLRSHVSKADYVPRRVEFFDKAGKPLKVLTVTATQTSGGVVLPTRTTMEDLQKGTSTRMEVLEHQLNVPPDQIPDETFTAAFMERSG